MSGGRGCPGRAARGGRCYRGAGRNPLSRLTFSSLYSAAADAVNDVSPM